MRGDTGGRLGGVGAILQVFSLTSTPYQLLSPKLSSNKKNKLHALHVYGNQRK